MATQLQAGAPTQHQPRFIDQIDIEDLYGLYTYRLGLEDGPDEAANRLFILYGDNGSGKTTVLRLAFNLLSRAEGQGHRTFVARVPFRRLTIILADKTSIAAAREGESLLGEYRVTIKRGRKTLYNDTISINAEGGAVKDQPSIDTYVSVLQELNVELFFLGDDRKGQSSLGQFDEAETYLLMRMQHEELARTGRRVRPHEMQLRGEQILDLAVGRFNEWAQRQAYEASSAGEANTNNVYAEIVRHIARAPVAEVSEAPAAGMLRTRLLELEVRSQTYSALGLVSLLQVGTIVRELEKSPPDVQDLIGRVVRPYVQGIEARLNALERLQRQLSSFVESLNSFFSNKELSFRLPVGLEIRSKNGDFLTPNMLSSGERQLLLLFCNTAIARDRSSIFLIDEPEISLNVKWQRKLLGSLLEITAESPVQFVIATHSLELLSQFRHSVRRLSNLREVARDA